MRRIVEAAMAAASHLRPRGVPVVKQIDDTYAALASLGAEMARFPGRKSLVWVTDGVPLQIRMSSGEFFDYTPMLARVSDSLRAATIAVYPVAVSGQNIMGNHLSLLMMEKIAALTGGSYSVRDVVSAVERASADGKAAYTLQYYPSDQKQNGKYHKVRVTLERKGVDVLSEQGYYAESKSDSGLQTKSDDSIETLRNSALLSPYNYRAIPLTAHVTKNPGTPPSAHYELQIGIASLLPVDGSQKRYSGNVLMTYAEYDEEPLPQVGQPTPVKFDASSKDGIRLAGDMQLGRKVRGIRFIVVDPVTRAIGSITIPLSDVQ
ncbi:MAG TPA: VWA domain-containing protein [Bryobacteraceae bacterium]